MKIRAAVFLILLTPLVAIPQTSRATKPQQRKVFRSFHKSLRTLEIRNDGNTTKINTTGDEEAQLMKSIDGHVKFLEGITSSGKPIPRVYLESLALDAELLNKLANQKSRSKPAQARLLEGLGEVDSDLAIKVKQIKNGRGDGISLIQVQVRAKKGAQEVAGYEIWYVSRGWADVSSRFKRFDSLSNPSNPPSMNLPAGNYFLWLGKGKPPEPLPLYIGGDQKSKREIELVVP
jgi:hypothetical protein